MPGRIHLWHAGTADLSPGELESGAQVLAADERLRASELAFEADRRAFLLTRVLVRQMLAHYAGLGPARWRFRRLTTGRPVIANPGLEWVTFSVSHTRKVVMCAVGCDLELGGDVESHMRSVPHGIADLYFAAEEARALRELPRELQARRFVEYWTLKEAYGKALSMGLAVPLNRSCFRLTAEGAEVSFAPDCGDEPRRWHFFREEVSPGHLLAVAAGMKAPGPRPTLVLHRFRLETASVR